MKDMEKFARRGFVGVALAGVGGALGWLARRWQGPDAVRKATPVQLDSRFTYDVSEFEKTDPALLLYRPVGGFDTGMNKVKRVATTADNRVLVAGERVVKVFDTHGGDQGELRFERPPHCLFSAGPDELFVGLGDRLEVRDADGKTKFTTGKLAANSFLTAIAVHEDNVFVADAGSREILVCDRANGDIRRRFGKKEGENPGLVVPSPYFDLMVDARGGLQVANPGRLRMESYALDGRFRSSWGEAGMQIDRFCGCCNPVYFTMTAAGEFITSEKGLARINVYHPDGTFKGAVAGPDTLVEDKELARQACDDCTVGAGFDVAMGAGDRVLALDPYRKSVRVFAPKEVS